MQRLSCLVPFFFFNDTATTEIYTLSLHDALPISRERRGSAWPRRGSTDPLASGRTRAARRSHAASPARPRSEEHTSELQSLRHLVCRLLLEKKKKTRNPTENPQQHSSASIARIDT